MNEKGVKTEAWYCSDDSIKGGFDKEFGVNITWDIPLLKGYHYRFFKNSSWKPSIFNGFFGLINLGVLIQLFREPKAVIVVHGWNYFTHFMVLMLGKLRGHTICLRNDMPLSHEFYKQGWKQKIKKIGLKYFLFPRVNKFFYIGYQNKLFYKSYNIGDTRLVSCPYAVDNERFGEQYKLLSPKISEIKHTMGIPAGDKIIIFSGKYIEKKRPLDLLQAFKNLNSPNCWLIMVGEGELRATMEAYIMQHSLKQVILTGFVNQSKIAEYYAIGNVFVMCSSLGENWGLSVNEAMNFDLPLLLSDLTGCSNDLVKEGNNGYVFKTGDVDALTIKLNEILLKNQLSWSTSSKSIIDDYDFNTIIKNLRPLL
ncbi:glycosyltransferase [Maribacter stanieri]|uniref:glycosyltransferase n=1 Tax=Maribacter stanieri TaxID=440514 RepID=UPI0024953AA1|nr:glycosyltransferase [Maribacter stanieri]